MYDIAVAYILMSAPEGFDDYAGKRWVYPNNMPVRSYQKQAVDKALFHNAMIVLPTGFGKTFIAAVVMYNFYRWYPQGKIIFVAPTRPLVAQQILECRKISGIPASDCTELTGSTQSGRRIELWQSKRVFFATPQVIDNDLANSILPAKQVRCIVIDEAHKAQGGYAYVNIVRQLHQRNPNGFRVLALSATPGSDIQRVQQVMQNLFISEVMFRHEGALDLMAYKNEKSVKAWTVDVVGKHKEFIDRFIRIADPIFKTLYRAGLTYSGDSVDRVHKYTLVKAGQEIIRRESGANKGRLGIFCNAAIALSHNFELLTLYGIRVFYSSVMRAMGDGRNCLKVALSGNADMIRMLDDIRVLFGEDVELNPDKVPTANLFLSHPKLGVVRDLLEKHFRENADKTETRAMVFTKYRESVFDIVQSLKLCQDLKPGAFVGQGSASKCGLGMKQKEQIQMVQDFKTGKYNVLVATCVAEEGLDIGEIDLIICYDTSSSPISTTQRRGRTGRKRSGDVQTILTKGYEEKKLKKAGIMKRQVEEQLFKRENYMTHRYLNAPRMIPEGITPVCLEQKIFPVEDEPEVETGTRKKKEPKVKKLPVTKANGKRKMKDVDGDDDFDDNDHDDDDDDDDVERMKGKGKIKDDLKKPRTEGGFCLASSLFESDDEFETL